MRYEMIPVLSKYTADDAIEDGALIPLADEGEEEAIEDEVCRPIHEIHTIDDYLLNYGAILGKKAITALRPLHLPGVDPLPDFDLDRELFPAQQHVSAATVKMFDKRGSGFICGEMGCIAGESEVYDPVAGLCRRVDQITEPFHVEAWDDHAEKVVVARAETPFIKGTEPLYRVKLDSGRSFLCTHHHVVLTRRGWLRVDQLRVDGTNGDHIRRPASRREQKRSWRAGSYGWDAVVAITYERTDIYYDFTVNIHGNYVMAGVVHHNTGKTIIGAASVHEHAKRSRNKGGSNGKYRCIVLCPDHLVGKWCREIRETIPEAIIVRFGPQGDTKVSVKKKRRGKGEKALAEETKTRKTMRDTLALLGQRASSVRKLAPGTKAEGRVEQIPVSTGPDTFEMASSAPRATSGKVEQIRSRWAKPQGAEYYVLGRNQAKWLSYWQGTADPKKTFVNVGGRLGGTRVVLAKGDPSSPEYRTDVVHLPGTPSPVPREKAISSKTKIIDKVQAKNELGGVIYDAKCRPVEKAVLGRIHYCPKCGSTVRDKRGTPVGAKDLTSNKGVKQKYCEATLLRSIYSVERPNEPGGETISPIPEEFATRKPGSKAKHFGRDWMVETCGEPLFNYTSKPYRWSPSAIMQRKLKRMFKYLIIDEIHEHKSDESAQSMAASKLIGAVDHVLGLTGTIIGGYADHLYPLMMRITPATLKAEGFEWGHSQPFSETYGRVRTVVTTVEDSDGPSVSGRCTSMRKSRGAPKGKKYIDPGVMPTMFARHMMGTSIFITLEELADNLPDLFEYVGGKIPPSLPRQAGEKQDDYDYRLDLHARNEDGWFETAIDMEPDQQAEHDRVLEIMSSVNKELLQKGSMKFLGAMLWTGLDYPDRPFGWGHDTEVVKAFTEAQREDVATGAGLMANAKLGHTVGYWEKPGNKHWYNWVGVVTPKDLPEDKIYPKEQALIDICKKQTADGRQTWVYVNMTGKRNIQPRLKKLLEAEGLRVGILRSDTVEPIEREQWIEENGRDYDVMLSHPELVKTGLDLFSKQQGGHNYPTIVFYETGYNLFTMRQAARRAWRIGQPCDCRVYYLYYKGCMQAKAMHLMSRKMSAAQALEGEFSEEGLAAMAGEDNMQMALAKKLSERISEADMQRNWTKVKSGPKKKTAGASLDRMSDENKEKVTATIAAEIVIETMEDLAKKQTPATPEGKEFAAVMDKIAKVDDAFLAMTKDRPRDEPEPKPEMSEDICKRCGAHIGYGFPAFHLGYCDDCEPEPEYEEEEETVADDIIPTPVDAWTCKTREGLAKEIVARRLEPEAEPVILKMPDANLADNDNEEEDDEDDFVMPELTPEILAKMFANIEANRHK